MRRLVSRWSLLYLAAIGALVVAAALAWGWYETVPAEVAAHPTDVGQETCAKCHQPQYQLWQGSDHDLAMTLATEKTVEGDFNDAKFEYQGVTTRFFRKGGKFMVNTEGPDGQHHD